MAGIHIKKSSPDSVRLWAFTAHGGEVLMAGKLRGISSFTWVAGEKPVLAYMRELVPVLSDGEGTMWYEDASLECRIDDSPYTLVEAKRFLEEQEASDMDTVALWNVRTEARIVFEPVEYRKSPNESIFSTEYRAGNVTVKGIYTPNVIGLVFAMTRHETNARLVNHDALERTLGTVFEEFNQGGECLRH